jgi:V/A-type H+-transporting ATPase subunit K
MSMLEFINQNLHEILLVVAILMSIVLSGIGSATGAAMIGKAAAALISEQPEKFGKSLVLQMMSASQGLYGFIIGFLIFMNFGESPDLVTAFRCLGAGTIMGLTGYFTAIQQSVAATAGIQILAKKPEHSTKGVLYSAMIETYAIFAFVISVLIVLI